MIEKKKINQEEMQKYIQLLNLTFKPLKDFKSIKYAQEDRTGLEFMKISDATGGVAFYNVSGMGVEGIPKMVMEVTSGKIPGALIKDKENRRRANRLFD